MAGIAPQYPLPTPPWLRVAINVGPPLVSWLTDYFDVFGVADDVEDVQWRRLQVKFSRTAPTGLTEDAGINTYDIVNMSDGNLDTSWTDADFVTCETHFDRFHVDLAAAMTNTHTVDQYRWYKMQFNPLTLSEPFVPSGAPVRVIEKNMVGSSPSFPLPFQVAMSVTEKTPLRKHWGRVYLPGMSGAQLASAHGRWDSAKLATMANSVQNLHEDLNDDQFIPHVPVTQFNGQPVRSLYGIDKIQIDDIPDVIRSRRARSVNLRVIRPT